MKGASERKNRNPMWVMPGNPGKEVTKQKGPKTVRRTAGRSSLGPKHRISGDFGRAIGQSVG